MTDPIADYLTRIRNAYLAGKKIVEIPASNMKLAITKILCEKGYILSYKVVEGTPANNIKIALKYHPETKAAAVKSIVRVSTPGLRKYADVRPQRPRHRRSLHLQGCDHRQGSQRPECRRRGDLLCLLIYKNPRYVKNWKTACSPSGRHES